MGKCVVLCCEVE